MKTKNLKLIVVLLLISNFINAQVLKSESDNIKYQKGLGIETFYQGNYSIGLVAIVGNNIGSKKKTTYAVGIYTDVFFPNTPIIGPRIKATINGKGVFGVSGISLNFCNYYRNGTNDFRVAADLNLSTHGIMTLFVGYGFSLSKNRISEVSQLRVGLNLALVNNMDKDL